MLVHIVVVTYIVYRTMEEHGQSGSLTVGTIAIRVLYWYGMISCLLLDSTHAGPASLELGNSASGRRPDPHPVNPAPPSRGWRDVEGSSLRFLEWALTCQPGALISSLSVSEPLGVILSHEFGSTSGAMSRFSMYWRRSLQVVAAADE